MVADVNTVVIAREARDRWEYEARRPLLAAQGVNLPPYDPAEKPALTASGIKAMARIHNASFKAKERKARAV